jgi:hypothetical protein
MVRLLIMAKRKPADDTAKMNELYRAARADAQARANELGYDHGLEWNAIFKHFHVFMLPQKRNRYGFELRCEVVYPERLENCKPGHGPNA